MKKAVASTGYLPSTILPAPSAITRSDGVISDQCRPCGLTRNRSSRPGTVMLKWLHTPSFRPWRTAALSAVTRSIRAWVIGSLASIEGTPSAACIVARMMRPRAPAAKENCRRWREAVDQAGAARLMPPMPETSRTSLVRTARPKWSKLSATIMNDPGPPMTFSS